MNPVGHRPGPRQDAASKEQARNTSRSAAMEPAPMPDAMLDRKNGFWRLANQPPRLAQQDLGNPEDFHRRLVAWILRQR